MSTRHKRPNILFIMSDQHRWDCLGAHGHDLIKTPRLDQLHAESVQFENAFTPTPICVPARCSLLSGKWPVQHGVIHNFDGEVFHPLDPAQPTSASVLADAGYHTVHIGHWHVHPRFRPMQYGFHEEVAEWRYQKWRQAQGILPVSRDQGWKGQTDNHITPDQSRLGWLVNKVKTMIDLCAEDDDPFFIRMHFKEPHLPCQPPEPYASMYRPEDVPRWPGFDDPLTGKPLIQRQMRATWNVEGMPWEDWAPIVARYLAEISHMDHHIGCVLDYLDQVGLRDNTVVIYTTDHGDMCGSHGMVDKHNVMYDDVVRVPLIIRIPGVAGRAERAFVSNMVDLPATFCGLAGIPVAETFSGMDLTPLLSGKTREGRHDIFASFHGNQFGSYSQRMVRDQAWKYIWNATAEDELYHLAEDPGELHNLAYETSGQAELTRLRQRLAAWMEQVDDPLLNNWTRGALLEGRIV